MPKINPLLAVGVVVGLLVLAVGGFFLSLNGTQKEMVAQETAISAKYRTNQVALSTYVNTIKESLGVADRNSQALDKVLTDVVSGRYQGDTTVKPGGGELFSAITEAYPDLTQMSVNYANVQTAIFAGRESFKNDQGMLVDMVRAYKVWMNSDFFHSKMVALVGAPSDNLTARTGDQVLYGRAALDQIERLVISGDATNSYETGQDDALDLGEYPNG